MRFSINATQATCKHRDQPACLSRCIVHLSRRSLGIFCFLEPMLSSYDLRRLHLKGDLELNGHSQRKTRDANYGSDRRPLDAKDVAK